MRAVGPNAPRSIDVPAEEAALALSLGLTLTVTRYATNCGPRRSCAPSPSDVWVFTDARRHDVASWVPTTGSLRVGPRLVSGVTSFADAIDLLRTHRSAA